MNYGSISVRMVVNIFLFPHIQIHFPSSKNLYILIFEICLFIKNFWLYPGGCVGRGMIWRKRLQEMKLASGPK